MDGFGEGVVGIVAIALLIVLGHALYLAPTIVAVRRAHHQVRLILLVNVLFGWTVVGWVVALGLASSETRPRW